MSKLNVGSQLYGYSDDTKLVMVDADDVLQVGRFVKRGGIQEGWLRVACVNREDKIVVLHEKGASHYINGYIGSKYCPSNFKVMKYELVPGALKDNGKTIVVLVDVVVTFEARQPHGNLGNSKFKKGGTHEPSRIRHRY